MSSTRLPAAARRELAAIAPVLNELLPPGDAPPDAIAALRARKLRVLLGWVARHVPLYARLGLGPEPELGDFPAVDKARLMLGLPHTCAEPDIGLEQLRGHIESDERGSRFLLFRDTYYVRRTSGTTGFVGFFLWDDAMAAHADASATRFVPAPHRLPKPVLAVAPVVVWHPLQAVFGGLHMAPLDEGLAGAVDRIHALRPATILGSPGFVAMLAGEQLAGRLDARPEVIVVGSEQCTPLQRDQMRAAWGVEPLEQYGVSEGGLIATRCPDGNYHVHADTVILELLGEDGRPVAPGEPCARALLTRLFGPVQPILRYELGDVLVAGPEHCPCGAPFPTIAGIRGRQQTRLWLRAMNGGGVVGLSAYVIVQVLETTPGLVRYQIRYGSPERLEIAIVAAGDADLRAIVRALPGAVGDALRRHGAVPPPITVRQGGLPELWAAPPGSKDHHVRLRVTREQMLAAVRSAPASGPI